MRATLYSVCLIMLYLSFCPLSYACDPRLLDEIDYESTLLYIIHIGASDRPIWTVVFGTKESFKQVNVPDKDENGMEVIKLLLTAEEMQNILGGLDRSRFFSLENDKDTEQFGSFKLILKSSSFSYQIKLNPIRSNSFFSVILQSLANKNEVAKSTISGMIKLTEGYDH